MSTYQVSRRFTLQDNNLYRMQVWVSAITEDLPCKIFAWQTLYPFPEDPGPTDIFVHVCKYSDLIAIPEDEPEPWETVQLYRRHWFDLESKDKARLESVWRKVKEQVQFLVQDIVRTNTLPPAEVGFVEI